MPLTVLLNAAAGLKQTDDRCATVAQLFAAAGVDARIIALQSAEHAVDVARRALAERACAIVAGGGDGTVSTVASTVMGTSTALGVLPLGTLNHFARDAGIPTDLEAAVAAIAAGHTARVDTGEVNGRTFLNNASIGIYPDIVVEREHLRQLGHRKWVAFAIAAARVVRRYRRIAVRLTADGATTVTRTAFLVVGNNEYKVDGPTIGARVSLNSGRLYAYLAPRVHARELPKLVALALAGRARERRALESFSAPDFQVDTPGHRHNRVALDGEVIEMHGPLAFRSRPGSLRVIVPAG
jgi:YegS/Rv2252/BmrU family lipid kinase